MANGRGTNKGFILYKIVMTTQSIEDIPGEDATHSMNSHPSYGGSERPHQLNTWSMLNVLK